MVHKMKNGYWNTYEDACHHMSLFDSSDQDIYKELILSEVNGNDERVLKRKVIKMGMYLLNSRPVLECEEDEWDKHSQEILDINNQLQGFPDYNCAVIVQGQDEAHRGKHCIE